jgi:SAM-dependent methyltransferase
MLSCRDIDDWNRNARYYGARAPEPHIYNAFRQILWEVIGDVAGQTVLDVGCGPGWMTNQFAQAGACVWGIDGSACMLGQARSAFPDITFVEHNLVMGLPEVTEPLDMVISYMVLMDLPDIAPLIRDIHKVLKSTGRFVFVIPHPAFFFYETACDPNTQSLYRKITGYLREEVWRFEKFGGHNHYHRSISNYIETLRSHQLTVTRLYEPASLPWPEEPPEVQNFFRQIPCGLLIEAMPFS